TTAVVLLSAPAAVGASDPCAASEMARTISNVARSAGDYLDGHPETNQAMTSAMQEPAGPQSGASLQGYFDANPKGGQRSAAHRVAARGAVEPVQDADQPAPGARLHAVGAGCGPRRAAR